MIARTITTQIATIENALVSIEQAVVFSFCYTGAVLDSHAYHQL